MNIGQRQLESLKSIGQNFDSDDSGFTADDVRSVDMLNGGKAFNHFLADASELSAVVPGTAEGEGYDWNVVDFYWLENPSLYSGWDGVLIFVELLEELDQAAFSILANIESNRNDRLVIPRHTVNVFDAIDLREHPF